MNDISNMINQMQFDAMALEDMQCRTQRALLAESLHFGEEVELIVPGRERIVLHYFGRITKMELESGMSWEDGKNINVEIDSNPGLTIHLDLRRNCVKEYNKYG